MELDAPDIYHSRFWARAALAYGVLGLALNPFNLIFFSLLFNFNGSPDSVAGNLMRAAFGPMFGLVLAAPALLGLAIAVLWEHLSRDQSVESTGWSFRHLTLQVLGVGLAWLPLLVVIALFMANFAPGSD
jgi:hypothetical protein